MRDTDTAANRSAPGLQADREILAKPLLPLDANQRYTIPESAQYLRVSRAYVYQLLARGELLSITDGKRRYIPGSQIIRRSTLPAHKRDPQG